MSEMEVLCPPDGYFIIDGWWKPKAFDGSPNLSQVMRIG